MNKSMYNGRVKLNNNFINKMEGIKSKGDIEDCINDYITSYSRENTKRPDIKINRTPKMENSPLNSKRSSKQEAELFKQTPREKFNQDIIGILNG
mmetsp:Transcript_15914/g.13901  ORF Transcript_15914/g.13901 Transcript_15914/m.13901 type:complete len:95 (-) Transcript_15914:16-300(-)